jgi:hypothetical protein
LTIGRLDDLIELSQQHDFLTAEFPQMDREKACRLLEPWTSVCGFVSDCVEAIRQRRVVPVNTGLFVARSNCRALVAWQQLLNRAYETRLTEKPELTGEWRVTDEPALELVRFANGGSVNVIDCCWNWSARFNATSGTAKIIHYHERSHVKNYPLANLWLKVFRDVNIRNLGGIRTWGPRLDPEAYAALG